MEDRILLYSESAANKFGTAIWQTSSGKEVEITAALYISKAENWRSTYLHSDAVLVYQGRCECLSAGSSRDHGLK